MVLGFSLVTKIRLKPKDLTVWLFFWSMKGVLILNAETSTLRIE